MSRRQMDGDVLLFAERAAVSWRQRISMVGDVGEPGATATEVQNNIDRVRSVPLFSFFAIGLVGRYARRLQCDSATSDGSSKIGRSRSMFGNGC